MEPTRLNPCPFCGSPAARSYDPVDETTIYLCSDRMCGAWVIFRGAGVKTREDADRAWNSRTSDSKPI